MLKRADKRRKSVCSLKFLSKAPPWVRFSRPLRSFRPDPAAPGSFFLARRPRPPTAVDRDHPGEAAKAVISCMAEQCYETGIDGFGFYDLRGHADGRGSRGDMVGQRDARCGERDGYL